MRYGHSVCTDCGKPVTAYSSGRCQRCATSYLKSFNVPGEVQNTGINRVAAELACVAHHNAMLRLAEKRAASWGCDWAMALVRLQAGAPA